MFTDNTTIMSGKMETFLIGLEKIKDKAKSTFENYYNRKLIIDIIIIANLAITPLLTLFLAYWVFFK